MPDQRSSLKQNSTTPPKKRCRESSDSDPRHAGKKGAGYSSYDARSSIILKAKFNNSSQKNDTGSHQIVIPEIQIKGAG
jgi:hypothetical protein